MRKNDGKSSFINEIIINYIKFYSIFIDFFYIYITFNKNNEKISFFLTKMYATAILICKNTILKGKFN